jgi:hypothetical protein
MRWNPAALDQLVYLTERVKQRAEAITERLGGA